MEARLEPPCCAEACLACKVTGPRDRKVRNRFKGLDLIDRVPDELWMEVRDIVQETGNQPKRLPRNKLFPFSQGSNRSLLHFRQILYSLSHHGSPR